MQKTVRELLVKGTSAVVLATAFAPAALAQVFGPVPNIAPGQQNLRQTVLDVINKVLTFMALAAVAFIVVAGIPLHQHAMARLNSVKDIAPDAQIDWVLMNHPARWPWECIR